MSCTCEQKLAKISFSSLIYQIPEGLQKKQIMMQWILGSMNVALTCIQETFCGGSVEKHSWLSNWTWNLQYIPFLFYLSCFWFYSIVKELNHYFAPSISIHLHTNKCNLCISIALVHLIFCFWEPVTLHYIGFLTANGGW